MNRFAPVLAVALAVPLAQAQNYPAQPVRIVVPQPAGSGSDVIIRLLAEKMRAGLGQPVVVDNKAGASGAIAAESVARAASDGYTLFACTSSTNVMLPLINTKLSFDPRKDFAPIGIISKAENTVVVPASSPFKSLSDLVAYGRTHPGKLSYGTAGVGTTHHLAAELLQSQGNFVATHVPYKGTPLAEGDLVSGRLDFMINNTAPALPNIRAGKSRALLVTGAARSPELPNTPTSAESGLKDFEVYGFAALCAPAGTPRPVIDRLHGEMVKAVAQPDMQQRLLQLGFDGKTSTPEELAGYTAREIERWGKVIKEKNIRFD
jgi:tripartite-type tricarboxylate transporter receptor subunit TctC